MKKIELLIIIFSFSALLYSQENHFKSYERAFYEFSPYVELNSEEKMNHSNSKIKKVTEYLSKAGVLLDNIERDFILNKQSKKFLYKYGIFEFDSLGNLIKYEKFDEKGYVNESILKEIKPDSILRITFNRKENFEIIEAYTLNKYGMPEIMISGNNLKLKYYYNDDGDLIRIDALKKGLLETKYEFKYKRNDQFVTIECSINGLLSTVYKYENKYLFEQNSYNIILKKEESINLYTYKNDKIVKEILLKENKNGMEHYRDVTFLYNKDGLLFKELLYDKAYKDIIVTEYIYNSNRDLSAKLNYYLNESSKILGCAEYEYEYY